MNEGIDGGSGTLIRSIGAPVSPGGFNSLCELKIDKNAISSWPVKFKSTRVTNIYD